MLIFILLAVMLFLVVPYRVKNPPRTFPVATVVLIGINLLVHLIACNMNHPLFAIRRDSLMSFALRWGESPVHTVFTAMFLHGDIFHLAGNMLYLWVFGPAVEDRLGIPRYILLYFLAGFSGTVAQVALDASGILGVAVPTIGASGCIFGVLGAYWYIYSWSPVCIFYSILWFFRGTFELKAMWVIGAYFIVNIYSGIQARSAGSLGGVANFAHVGGAAAGLLLAFAFQVKRDSSEVSEVKAAHAEVKDLNLLSCADLRKLVESAPDDEALLIQYAQKAVRDGDVQDMRFALDRNLRAILTNCPDAALTYVAVLQGPTDHFTPGDLVYLGKLAEQQARPGQALQVYELIEKNHPNSPEIEVALYRTAAVLWHRLHDGPRALAKVTELLTRFPSGRLMFEAEDLRDDITRQQGTASQAA
ncbi:MAG: rhomboid family intramembrane serine protease [Armatimonadetes bacterium]|nr:rhomboid family intramembrane serine protease [Armatimonadota bacterium]